MAASVWTLTKVYASPYRVVYKADCTVVNDGLVTTKDITCTGAVTPDLVTDSNAGTKLRRVATALTSGITTQPLAESRAYGGTDPESGIASKGTMNVKVVKSSGTATAGDEVTVLANTDGAGALKFTVSYLPAAVGSYHITVSAIHSAGR